MFSIGDKIKSETLKWWRNQPYTIVKLGDECVLPPGQYVGVRDSLGGEFGMYASFEDWKKVEQIGE